MGPAFSRHSLWYNVGEPKRGAEGSTTLDIVHYIYAIGSGHLEWLVYAASLLCSVLPDALVAYRRGFGMRGFRFGRRRARLVKALQAPVRTAVHHRSGADRARGAGRLPRIPVLQEPTSPLGGRRQSVTSSLASAPGR